MKLKRFAGFVILLIVIAGVIFVIINNFGSEKTAKLQINSNITEDVYVDGVSIGHTFPYEGTYKPKVVVVKIGDFEANVYLQAGVKTVVNRDFQDGKSYGEVTSFEKTGQSYGTVAVISNPSKASVLMDEKDYGVTPINLENVSEGVHKLTVTAPGYDSRSFQINVYKGYKLTSTFDLFPSLIIQELTTESEKLKTIVEILSTPNGFLRVRKEPTTQSSEVSRVKTGEKFELESIDKKSGWYEIRIDATTSGWISGIYAATSSSVLRD